MSITILQHHRSTDHKSIRHKFDMDVQKKCYVLSEGASESFKPETWAEIISGTFAKNPRFYIPELITSLKAGAQQFRQTGVTHDDGTPAGALEKRKQPGGSTASLIGLQLSDDNRKLNVVGCGNCNLFIIKNIEYENSTITSFPYNTIASLDANRSFLNTEQLIQGKLDESFFRNTTIEVEKSDTIILVTGSLGRMLLKKNDLRTVIDLLKELIAINDYAALHHFCLKHKQGKELEDEEISVMILNAEEKDVLRRITPPMRFAIHKDEKHTHVPASHTGQQAAKEIINISELVINVDEKEQLKNSNPAPDEQKHKVEKHESKHIAHASHKKTTSVENVSGLIVNFDENGPRRKNEPAPQHHKDEKHSSPRAASHKTHKEMHHESHRSSGHRSDRSYIVPVYLPQRRRDSSRRRKKGFFIKKEDRLYTGILATICLIILLLLGISFFKSDSRADTMQIVDKQLHQKEADDIYAERIKIMSDSINILNSQVNSLIIAEQDCEKRHTIVPVVPKHRVHKYAHHRTRHIWHHHEDVPEIIEEPTISKTANTTTIIKTTKITTTTKTGPNCKPVVPGQSS